MKRCLSFIILFFMNCALPEEKTMPEVFAIDLDNDVKVNKDEIFEGEADEDTPGVEISNNDESFDSFEIENLPDSTDIEKEISCVPVEYEICGNKIDDDCDGETDEENTGKKCFVGLGKCREEGNVICSDGKEVCNAKPGEPQDEVCNQLDDDCDGETDEGLLGCCEPGTEQDCGFNDLGECKMGKKECLEDGSWSNCEDAVFPEDELCDGKDNDCDGATDETFSIGQPCEVGIGECLNFGQTICAENGKDVVCDAKPGEPQDELCDGLDNNCNGETDENWPELGSECEVGIGECKASGKIVCKVPAKVGDDATVCDAQPGIPSEEICDQKDNNCNGLTDETFPELDTNCSVGKGECKKDGIFVCETDPQNPKFGFSKCNVVPGEPQEEICDLKDNNCDGETDNVASEKLQSDNQHCGQCFKPCTSLPNAKSVQCQNGKCVPTECQPKFWDADKIPENGCECQISSNAVEICDGKDNDCDGATDEWCDNLVMYLPFDGDWNDKSKYGNNATPYNGATFTSDAILGKAAYFDGVDDYAVVINSVSLETLKEEFTYFVGVKVGSLKKSGVFDKESRRPAIWTEQCGSNYCFIFYLNGKIVENQKIIDLNKQYLITLRYSKGQVVVYFDGKLYWEGNTDYPHDPGLNPLYIGSIVGIGFLYGIIDEFVFYNKALSDEEIANYYQKIK